MKNQKIRISNAMIVSSTAIVPGDVIISGSTIEAVGQNLEICDSDCIEIDAKGKYLLPGAIDAHVHLDLPTPAGPSSDNFKTGSLAALWGGTTCIIDFVTPAKGENLVEAVKKRKEVAQDSLIDYSFHLGISGWHPGIQDEIRQCIEKEGLSSLKAYLAYRDTIGIDYRQLEDLMEICHRRNVLLCIHCEDGHQIGELRHQFIEAGQSTPHYHALSRPPESEYNAVKEAIRLSAKTDCPVYLVHISTAESVKAIAKAREKGLRVFAESCPQYLMLDKSAYELPLPEALAYIISPPLREENDRAALWNGLQTNIIDTVSTDHCPFMLQDQKDLGMNDFTKVPNGCGGIETRLPLLYTYGVEPGRIDIMQMVSLISEMPARIFQLFPRKGVIMPGSDADLILWDPEPSGLISQTNLHQHCDHTVFEGIETKGQLNTIIRGGNLVILNNAWCAPENLRGSFIPRSSFPI